MNDPRIIKLSKLLVNYCVEVQLGDNVLLICYALPLDRPLDAGTS